MGGPPPSSGGGTNPALIVVLCVLVLGAIVGAAILLTGGDDDDEPTAATTTVPGDPGDPGQITLPSTTEGTAPTTTEGGSTGSGEGGPPSEPPSSDDPTLAGYADDCYQGDMQACDDLFRESDLGSELEDYGDTCGERLVVNPNYCVDALPNPEPPA
jgi:hypothetical protein